MMLRYPSALAWVALAALLCLPLDTLAAEIRVPLKEVVAEWLAAERIKDASPALKLVLDPVKDRKKALVVGSDFGKAILAGNPLDPERHSLAVALNLLRLSDFTSLIVVTDYKENGVTAFVESDPTVLGSGCLDSEVDLATIPVLKALGKVECHLKGDTAKADSFKVEKGKPGTARLTFTVRIEVVSEGHRAEYRHTFGPYRITAWEDVAWRKLEKWK
jgi:hypothetical protein